MLNEPGNFFDDKVVHRYDGETIELRTVARLLHDDPRDWEFERVWFDIEFVPYDHSAAYTVFMARRNDGDQIEERMRIVVPATSAAHGFLFSRHELPLAYEMQEWARAAYYLWQRTDKGIAPLHNADFVEAVLADFLKSEAEEVEYAHLRNRLRQLPINAPYEDDATEEVRKTLRELYDTVFEHLESIAADERSLIEPGDLQNEGPRQVLDLWADLEWYAPYW